MSRTGTKTLNEALKILLDGPVHDSGIQSLGGSHEEIAHWLEILELAPRQAESLATRKKVDYLLAAVTEGYVATMDCPAALLTPELLRVHPDAVVVATTRDAAAWWRSMRYVNALMGTWYLPLVVVWLAKAQVYGRWRARFGGLLRWRLGDAALAAGTLARHEAHLRRVVPPARLLWFRVADGWPPLCRFLDLPVPDRPFPHNNDQAGARQVYLDHLVAGLASWLFALAFLAVGTCSAVECLRRWAP